MNRIIKTGLALLVCFGLMQTESFASSHREAPLISTDPLADNTDVYAFKSPADQNKIILIANYIPFEHPAGGPNWYTFGENIRYEIHVDNNTATTGDDIIYRFTFTQMNEDPTTFFRIRLGKENWKTVYRLERSTNGGSTFTTIVNNGIVPPPNIGPRSIESAVGLNAPGYETLMTNAIATASTGERVFAGPIDDPFFVDLGGIFDLGNIRQGAAARDGLAKFNCHSLVIEVPVSTLQKDGKTVQQAANILDGDFVIGVYASASRQQITTLSTDGSTPTTSGDWVQVSRLGMPLTNEAIIPIGDKDQWNFTQTGNESQFFKYFVNPELALYMDDSQFGTAVPGLSQLRIQTNSLGAFDFRNGKPGLFPVRGTSGVAGTAFAEPAQGGFAHILLPDNMSPRAVDLLPIFFTGVPNLRPYQLATGKNGDPLAAGKPFINNFLPTFGDVLRLNMAVPATPRNSTDFSSLGLVQAAVLGLTDARFNTTTDLQFIPNMDGFPNGRRLEDDVTRISLQAVSGVVLAAIGLWYDDYNGTGSPVTQQLINVLSFTAGPTTNDTTFKEAFPFVQTPWRGFVGASYSGTFVLPVKWLSFTANKVANERVTLRWTVAESSNDRFEVEHSVGSGTWTSIGVVTSKGEGTNHYEFTHATPSYTQVNSYRIKQIDNDGTHNYSIVKTVVFQGKKALIAVSPNPASNFINIQTSVNDFNVQLFDQGGKRVLVQNIRSSAGRIDITALPRGVYMVIAEKDGVQLESIKVVKQ